jgi:hypothetical protein
MGCLLAEELFLDFGEIFLSGDGNLILVKEVFDLFLERLVKYFNNLTGVVVSGETVEANLMADLTEMNKKDLTPFFWAVFVFFRDFEA